MNREMKFQVRFVAIFLVIWQIGNSFVNDVGDLIGRSSPGEPWYGLQFVFTQYNFYANYLAPLIVFAFLWAITKEKHHD